MLQATWNYWAVGASVLIAALASFVALDLAGRVRNARDGTAVAWKAGGSLAMGTGIWSMHFVGMLAFKLPIELGYDVWLTLLSWIAAVAVSGLALLIAARPHLTGRNLTLGAVLMGIGISAMHYTGMAALVMSPGIVWHHGLVGTSVLIAIVASAAALHLFFWLRARRASQHDQLQKLAAATVMGFAIAGMHYTGMAAAEFPLDSVCLSRDQLGGSHLLLIVGTGTAILLSLTLLTSALDVYLRERTSQLAESLKVATEELQRVNSTDAVTGLTTRLIFDERLAHAAARARRQHSEFAVLVADLDGFRLINDSMGHVVGDQLLREAGARLRQVCRTSDTLARVGGDEFLVLIEDQTISQTQTLHVAKRILAALSRPYVLPERDLQLSCSIGIAMYPIHADPDRLVTCAEAAMYAAKRAGGATTMLYQEHMDTHTREQLDMLHDLHVALETRQLQLFYQPKVCASTQRITGTEALLRWQHPVRGTVDPATFIPLAERFGLIVPLGNWVIDEVCRQITEWRAQGLNIRVALNLSMHQLQQDSLIECIQQALRAHHVDPALLTFEITESVAMNDVQVTLRVFERLCALGAQLSIDDFGTGYSSLSYLRRLPAQQLKIDRSFVADLETSADARAIVDAVVRLGHALGLKIVAEGVETRGQSDILSGLGCDELQGFLFARPMPAAMLGRWASGLERPNLLEFSDSIYPDYAI